MKLEVFDFIEESISRLRDMEEELREASEELGTFFKEEFSGMEFFLNLSSRVKTEFSLKEKILRNNYYLKYSTSEEMLHNLSDLIGIRAECRFIEDEAGILKHMIKRFNITEDNKYFRTEQNDKIFLNLSEKQPQEQKNGFKIYRVDGRYYNDSTSIAFEFQIKSLVNMFWSEIEHKILYKNYNYLMIEDFYRDIMSSIKESLEMIDRQLLILYKQLGDTAATYEEVNEEQLKAFLSSIVHRIYIKRIKEDLGFAVDFKKLCDTVVEYIFRKMKTLDIMVKGAMIMSIVKRFGDGTEEKLSFSDYIKFERYVKFEDEFARNFGEPILGVINKDFMWNLLFTILFEIEPGNNAEDFEGFIVFFRNCFLTNLEENYSLNTRFEETEKEEIIVTVMNAISDVMLEDTDIAFMNFENIDRINSRINYRISRVKGYEDWKEQSHEFKIKIKEDIRTIIS